MDNIARQHRLTVVEVGTPITAPEVVELMEAL
jgi:hypothetical protein